LYQSKGTPASYKFLFRVLYDSDVDFFYTKDVVLRASAGTWYVPRSLRLLSQDPNFLKLTDPKYGNLKIFGENTKSLATIENVILAGDKTEVFITDIERLFQSGEFVHVIDSNNQTLLFNSEPLRAKIVGQISQVLIDPDNRGLIYQKNDPVVIYGGLATSNGHGALASVGTTTTGSIQKILVEFGGYGYTLSASNSAVGGANTFIQFSNLGPGAATPAAIVGSVDPSANTISHVTLLPTDIIGLKSNTFLGDPSSPLIYNFATNPAADINTRLIDAFKFTSFETFPISSIVVNDGGGNISQTPIITPQTLYTTEGSVSHSNLRDYGILAPIQIISSGTGYAVNDTINIIGGSGFGAAANVLSVSSNGSIISVGYVSPNNNNHLFSLGGMGYRTSALPTLTINSANGANAILQVTSVLGDTGRFTPTVDRIGKITSIAISDYGVDYIAAPNVSLRVQDLIVTGLSLINLPATGDIIYQGVDSNTASYIATVDSIEVVNQNAVASNSIYSIRVFNYNSSPIYSQQLKISNKNITMRLTNQLSSQDLNKTSRYSLIKLSSANYNSTSATITYGDGNAKANATFLNGLVVGNGQYLNTTGQPSSYDVLQNEEYNNYTYELTTSKEITKYKDILLNLLHPTGMQVKGVFGLTSSEQSAFGILNSEEDGHNLSYYTGNPISTAIMVPPASELLIDSGFVVDPVFQQFDFGYENDPVTYMLDYQTNDEWYAVPNDGSFVAANTVYFEKLNGSNLANFITTDSTIQLTTSHGDVVYSDVNFVNYVDNYITLKDYTWLTYSNVATVSGNANSNIINIQSLTGNYDYYNNGKYTNSSRKLIDVVRIGDSVLLPNNIAIIVNNVDYVSNTIYLDSNLVNTVVSAPLSVGRSYFTSNVQIFNPVIPQYVPEIITEVGEHPITTEDNIIILE